eukprot:3611240-Pyramimonas_sp.AAC.1
MVHRPDLRTSLAQSPEAPCAANPRANPSRRYRGSTPASRRRIRAQVTRDPPTPDAKSPPFDGQAVGDRLAGCKEIIHCVGIPICASPCWRSLG